jgi:hypothetical protein
VSGLRLVWRIIDLLQFWRSGHVFALISNTQKRALHASNGQASILLAFLASTLAAGSLGRDEDAGF